MDLQTTVFLGFASLVAAGAAVSAGGWILFVRERRSHRAGRAAAVDSPGDVGAPGVRHDGHDEVDAER